MVNDTSDYGTSYLPDLLIIMCDKIHMVIHIEKNLLIVIHQKTKGWVFRLVNCHGQVMEEKPGFETASEAEDAGRRWLENFTGQADS